MLPARDSPGPVATMFPSHPFHEGCRQGEICLTDLLHAKIDPIVHQPTVGTQSIPLLACMPQVHIVRELPHPH